MRKALRNLFVVLVFILPFIYLPITRDPFEFQKISFFYLISSIIFVIWGIKVFIEKKISFPKNKAVFFALLFVIVNLVSLVFSIHPYTSFFGNYWRWNGGFLNLIFLFGLFFTFIETFHDDEEISLNIFEAMTFSGFAVSLMGISDYLMNHGAETRIGSTIGQPNFLGAFLVMVLPINLYLFAIEKNVKQKLFWVLTALACLCTLFVTFSRSSILGFIIGIVLVAAIYRKRILATLIKRKYLFLILIPVILASLFLFKPISEKLKVSSVGSKDMGTLYIRTYAWKGAWNIFRNNPLLGTGPDTLMFAFSRYKDANINNNVEWYNRFDKAHNEPLDVLANTGIFAFIWYIFLWFFILKYSIFNKNKKPVLVFLGVSLMGFFITNLAGFSTVVTSTYLWILFGLVVILDSGQVRTFSLGKKYIRFPLLLLSFAVPIAVLAVWSRVYIAQVYETRGDLQMAVKTNPYQETYHGELAGEFLSEGKADESLVQIHRACELNPQNSDNFRILGEILGKIGGKDGEAIQAFDRAISLDPNNPTLYLEKANTYLKMGDKEAAKQSALKALEVKPDYQDAKNFLIQLVL